MHECPRLSSAERAIDNFDAVRELLATNTPDDDTSTAESIEVAARHLTSIPGAGARYLVLATDGEPESRDSAAIAIQFPCRLPQSLPR